MSLLSPRPTIYLSFLLKYNIKHPQTLSVMDRTAQFPADWQSPSSFYSSHLPTYWLCCPSSVLKIKLLIVPSYTTQKSESVKFSAAILCTFMPFLPLRAVIVGS